jgi:hypothetical protein
MSKKEIVSLFIVMLLVITVGCSEEVYDDSLPTYQVCIEIDGSGQVFGCGEYREGELIQFRAIPEEGHMLIGWYLDDFYISRDLEIEAKALQNFNLVAKFRIEE